MIYRTLGRTGEELSVIGFGGIVVKDVTAADASRLVGRAREQGLNYFDVAPSYGNAEERLGPALEPFRQEVFLAAKTGERTAQGARRELENTLRTLRTDHLDLYQFHGLSKLADVAQLLAPGGAMETFQAARDAGQVRYLGFSTHSEEAGLALLAQWPECDSVLFPVNCACWQAGGFGPTLAQRVRELGCGFLALKALARRPWGEGEIRSWEKCWYRPVDDPAGAVAALRFTFSRGVTAAVSPGHAELLWLACDAAQRLAPELRDGGVALSDAEAAAVVAELGAEPLFRNPVNA